MSKYILLIAILFLSYGNYSSISLSDDKEKKSSGNEKTINLTGNKKELVIILGFPDRNQSYPVLNNENKQFPLLGAFPDGTLLTDYIDAHGGSIPIDEWYKPALNHYFNSHSGGLYTVNFDFMKRTDGKVYTTKDSLEVWIRKAHNRADDVIWNNWHEMAGQVAETIYQDNKNAFDNVTAIHFVFSGMNKNEFNTQHGGTVDWNTKITGPSGNVYFEGPVSIQREVNAIAHERMHMIGRLSGSPKGFIGFPDRGFDLEVTDGHSNLLYGYDMMYHNASIVSQHSLYGWPPITSHDLIFLGWIKPEEILTIDQNNFKNYKAIKLSDVNYPLTKGQMKNGFKRVVKIMIKQNYSNNLDEYFLLEFHNATEFDRNFSNYDEFPSGGYNKGILIWHIKEVTPLLNIFSDNLIDLVTAVPYNGFYGKPLPDDEYPRDYKRPANWNGNHSGDYDYLDDDKMLNAGGGHWQYRYLPDGGRSLWEITTKGLKWGWYPKDSTRFARLESMKSDFFTDEMIKGHISSRFTDATRPSTKTWGGNYGGKTEASEQTHIAVTDIRHENDYMTVNVSYNYWEGTITANSVMKGNVTIGNDLTVPEKTILKIEPGTRLTFLNNSKLIVNGTLQSEGTSKSNIILDFNKSTHNIDTGIELSKGAKAEITFTKVKNSRGSKLTKKLTK